ncbi:hypothetical protein LCGC14_1448030 [marine sediment metagenome]|uniref:Uncharacterized protein n=1 Tax=marine sediment metagenome TaxID=412755 RepID=A0A0F9MKH2_9ZZZZ
MIEQTTESVCANCGRIRTFRLTQNETYPPVTKEDAWSERPIVCTVCGYSFTAGVFADDVQPLTPQEPGDET